MAVKGYRDILTEDYFHGKPLEIGHGPQFVISDIIVEDFNLLKRELDEPVRYSDQPVMAPELPWEHRRMNRCSILYDEDEKIYKMWYCGGMITDHSLPDWEKNLESGNCPDMVCYAESEDGVTWVRPMLDIIPFGKWEKNNIVFTGHDLGGRNGSVFINPDKSDKERKYFMIWNEGFGVNIATSPDGLHWTNDETINPVIRVPMDAALCIGYNETQQLWQMFVRPSTFAKSEKIPPPNKITPNAHYRRSVCITESSDLIHWSVPRLIYKQDEFQYCSETDGIHFFSAGDYPFAFYHLFPVHNLDDIEHQKMYPYFACGRDPYHLRPITTDTPTISRSERGHFDNQEITVMSGPHKLFNDNRDYFYYTAAKATRGEGNRITIGLLSYDENRFGGWVGDMYGGWLLTREFILDGSEIELDAEIFEKGEISVEILDGSEVRYRGGMPYSSFKLKECDPMTESSKHHVVKWTGSSDVSSLKGKRVYLRFNIINAKLYSFRVKE